MKKKTYLLALFVIVQTLLIFQNSFSQVTQEWVARYNGTGDSIDAAVSIAVDKSGNVYVTGYSYGSGSFSDYLTIKYNSAGNTLWVARYNGSGNYFDQASSIAIDGSGNVFVTGYSYGNLTRADCATIKYNSQGEQQWINRIIDGSGNSITVDSSGNVYVTGNSNVHEGWSDYITMKYSSGGAGQWLTRYSWGQSTARSIAVDGSGNVYVTGQSWDLSASLDDYVTIKYNSTGVQQWLARYNSYDYFDDEATSIALDSSGNVYVTGSRYGGNSYGTIKYNSTGEQQWVATYSGTGANSIAVDHSGNVYVTGKSSTGVTSYDYATIKYNTAGVQEWATRYNGAEDSVDNANCLALDDSGNVYVTGTIDGGYFWGGDYGTIKYNSLGIQQWIKRYDGPENSYDEAYSIAIDGSGNVYVTGRSYSSGTDWDFATIKYSQSTGISQISTILPEQFSLFQNFPNPFNPNTKINYELRVTSYAKLSVYDIMGREITTLVNEKQSPGTYQVDFDGSGLSSGVYFYRLTAGEFTDTKRMMILK